MGALGLFTFLPQCTVHNLRISELSVPVYNFLSGCIKFFPPPPREWKEIKDQEEGNGRKRGRAKREGKGKRNGVRKRGKREGENARKRGRKK